MLYLGNFPLMFMCTGASVSGWYYNRTLLHTSSTPSGHPTSNGIGTVVAEGAGQREYPKSGGPAEPGGGVPGGEFPTVTCVQPFHSGEGGQ